MRELVCNARDCAREGGDSRTAAILSGLVVLGDRRVFRCLGSWWHMLSAVGRLQLARSVQVRNHAGLVDWLISWTEHCEGDEFGVAAGRCRYPSIRFRSPLSRWLFEPPS